MKTEMHSPDSQVEESKLMKLLEDGLKDIYWAEKALVKTLPNMAKNASSPELVEAIEKHLAETEAQVIQVEKVFKLIGKDATAKKCDAMEGLIVEGKKMMEETDEGSMRDAAIILAAQKIEHYEIATYGTLRTFAQTLGFDQAARILDEILVEEKGADEKLSEIAAEINSQAAHEVE